MNKTLEAILAKYGAEAVIVRLMDQLNILAFSKDDALKQEAVELLEESGCDTEYIYSIFEFANLVDYVSEEDEVTDEPWYDKKAKQQLLV